MNNIGFKIISKMEEYQDTNHQVSLKNCGLYEPLRLWLFKMEHVFCDGKQSLARGKYHSVINKVYNESHTMVDLEDIRYLVENVHSIL